MTTADQPRYPEIVVTLIGEDGNALAMIGRVRRGLREAGVAEEELIEFFNEAVSGDYDHVIQTCMGWVTIE